MLKSSRCSVVFPTNGLALTGSITFQPGITAVVGRNGTGKTFRTIELWRYLLFGKKALRGPASDYKRLDAEGVVEIRGQDYKIIRSPKSESIAPVGEEAIAVGADAVNKKVIELLGFGLEVFDITNASVQKQSNKLTQLTPAKRKELVDEVCGLAQNEKAEKDCKDKAKLLRLEADTIRDNVRQPEEPKKPKGYKPSADLNKELAEARQVEDQRKELNSIIHSGIVFHNPQDKPHHPRQDIASLEAHERQRLINEAEYRRLEAIIGDIPTTVHTAEEVKAAQAWVQYDAEVARRGPKPDISWAEANSIMREWHKIEILSDIPDEIECPACSHKWHPNEEVPPDPSFSKAYCQEQMRRNNAWATPLEEPKGERIPHAELQAAHTAIARGKERYDLIYALSEIEKLPDRSKELADARTLNAQWDEYERQQESLRAHKEEQAKAAKELKLLPAPVDLDALQEQLVKARIYEAQSESYDREKADYLDKMAKVRDLSTEAGDFTTGAKRLAEARREVKAFLAPSLSRIASHLISEMTIGKLANVEVDDNMNVTVDGQDVTTLSGAGETAANLALRLALGKTLVGGVFPVFLGDEIDADADEERSEATFECLRNLKSQFAQVIMITHKPHVSADHVIDFDD